MRVCVCGSRCLVTLFVPVYVCVCVDEGACEFSYVRVGGCVGWGGGPCVDVRGWLCVRT